MGGFVSYRLYILVKPGSYCIKYKHIDGKTYIVTLYRLTSKQGWIANFNPDDPSMGVLRPLNATPKPKTRSLAQDNTGGNQLADLAKHEGSTLPDSSPGSNADYFMPCFVPRVVDNGVKAQKSELDDSE